MKQYLGVSAIFKDEAPYLEEWLRFYELVGVEHFYLYNNDSSDAFADVLAPWIASGKVTLHSIQGAPAQRTAVRHCLETYCSNCFWLAFLDLDEFLFAPGMTDLREFLRSYEAEPGVVANWVLFGASGHRHRPSDLVMRSYTWRCDLDLVTFEPALLKEPGLDAGDPSSYHPVCSHVKSVVNTRAVLQELSPHHFSYRDGRLPVTTWGERVPGPWTDRVAVDSLRVNHYFSRSWEEFARKLERGRADIGGKYDVQQMIERNKLFDRVHDTTILYLADKVQSRMRR